MIYDLRSHKYRSSSCGVWIKRLLHCGGRGASLSRWRHASTDSCFVRCNEEVNYNRWLGPIISAHRTAEGESFPTSRPEVVRFFRLYDQLYFNSYLSHWTKGMDLEYLNCSSESICCMSGWRNVEHIALPHPVRSKYYVQILASTQDEFKWCRVLTVPTKPDFAY